MKIEDFKKKNEEQIFVIDGGEQPPLLKYKKLEEIPWIRHCFTTREGGASKGIFAELEPQLYQRRRGSGGARELSTCC